MTKLAMPKDIHCSNICNVDFVRKIGSKINLQRMPFPLRHSLCMLWTGRQERGQEFVRKYNVSISYKLIRNDVDKNRNRNSNSVS